jgi:hypothetical protein
MATQDPAKLAPQFYKVVLDNDHVRVIDYRLKPGEKRTMHSHPSGVLLYYVTDATIGTAMDRIGRSGERFHLDDQNVQRLRKTKAPRTPFRVVGRSSNSPPPKSAHN